MANQSKVAEQCRASGLTGLRANKQLGAFVRALPFELRLDILSNVITGGQETTAAPPVSKKEYQTLTASCPWHMDTHQQPEPPKYRRLEETLAEEGNQLIFVENHACRPSLLSGLSSGLLSAMDLLDSFPAESMKLLQDDEGLHSAALDVLYIPGVGMWTSWLQYPAVAGPDLHTVRVQVRVMQAQGNMVRIAAALKGPEVRQAESKYTMLPFLLGQLWELGVFSAWSIDKDGKRSGSIRRVVVDVAPQRLTKDHAVSEVPTTLCNRCGSLGGFRSPASLMQQDQDSAAPAKRDALELANQTARDFAAGLERFLTDQDETGQNQSARIKQSISHVEIAAGRTTLQAFNISTPGAIRVQNNMTEDALRELNARLLNDVLALQAERMLATTCCPPPLPKDQRS